MNIKEVARRAKVSVATVSRVLNHPDKVRPETRDAILRVIQEMEYTPNWFARNLNLKTTNTLAILIPTIESPLYQKMIAGIEAIANERNYTLILCNTNRDPATERRHLSALMDRKVDGLIMTSSSLSIEELNSLALDHMPHAVISQEDGYTTLNRCYINFEEGAYQMTRHLLDMNQEKKHQRVHLFLDSHSLSRNRTIIQGVSRALADATQQPATELYCPNDMNTPYVIARNLIRRNELERLIVCSDDEIALAIMRAIHEMGLTVPNDYAIVGLSNSIFASMAQPPLTSMEQPAKKLGMVAARLLFDEIDGDPARLPVILQSVMKIRRSCGNRKVIHELQEV